MGFFDLMRWLGRHANGLRQLKNPKLRSVIFNNLTSAKKVTFRVKRGKYENRHEKCCQALLKKNHGVMCGCCLGCSLSFTSVSRVADNRGEQLPFNIICATISMGVFP